MGTAPTQNHQLRTRLAEARWTYADLAREVRRVAAESGVTVRTNSSAVAHWVAGTRPCDKVVPHLVEAISRRLGRTVGTAELGLIDDAADDAVGLTTEVDPVDTLTRLGRIDVERREVITGAAYSVAALAAVVGSSSPVERLSYRGGRAGDGEIAAVEDMVRMYTAIDERHGGQHGRSAVAQYLATDVTALCQARFGSEDQRRRMLGAAATVAYLCGWKAYDASEHSLAQRYYLQAYSLVRQADDPVHAAFILRILAHNGIDIERPEYTVDLAERAWDLVRTRTDPATRSLYLITRARAYAYAGRGLEARRAVDAAWAELGGGDSRDLPFHAALWGEPMSTVNSHTAKTFELLGDLEKTERRYANAADTYGSQGLTRIAGLSLASAGRSQYDRGHVEAACATWSTALDRMRGIRSSRVYKARADIRRRLAVPRVRGLAAARDLRARLAESA